ncbi:MAG: hypothetical protein ACK5EY_07100, partial [Cyclobacteriaceae bacterium]
RLAPNPRSKRISASVPCRRARPGMGRVKCRAHAAPERSAALDSPAEAGQGGGRALRGRQKNQWRTYGCR